MTLEVEPPKSAPGGRGGRHGRRGGASRAVIPVGIVLGLLIVALLTPLTIAARVWYEARQDERPHSDAIVVLGAAQYNGKPSPTLRWRLQHALDLYRDGVAPTIVTVGGKQPGDNYTEAGSGRRWLVEEGGVPAGDVVAVPTGRDTLQSFEAVGRLYDARGWSSGVIVSDPWHSFRSERMAVDHGIEATASPTRSGPSVQTRETQVYNIVRETGAYLSYTFLGGDGEPATRPGAARDAPAGDPAGGSAGDGAAGARTSGR
ncbi:YdcF family protein [Actinomadura sp. WMMB 499]|uniref:YdcF family protein n=1 Tax=Actinomadura sp. WMMB 499 TaxID=1219491 RepID=UPI001243D982|nr:YdcF family protein [Actinomadura sp. WMMB 499]QFG25694.1 YdcF family protein [Actinomadura sp. WMMB 499]